MSNDRTLSVRIDDEIASRLSEMASQDGKNLTISDVIRGMIEESMQKVSVPFTPSTRLDKYRFYDWFSINDPNVNLLIEEMVHRSVNGFGLSGPNADRFRSLLEEIGIESLIRTISREYLRLGDVFPQKIISCPDCDGEDASCPHRGAMIDEIVIQDPRNISVFIEPLTGIEHIRISPTPEIMRMIKAGAIDLPEGFKKDLERGRDVEIPNTDHLKRGSSGYSSYGHSVLQSVLQILMNRDRLRLKMYSIGQDPDDVPPLTLVSDEIKRVHITDCRRAITSWIENDLIGFLADRHDVDDRPSVTWGDIDILSDDEKMEILRIWKAGMMSDRAMTERIGISPSESGDES